jgi:hypothetical protein
MNPDYSEPLEVPMPTGLTARGVEEIWRQLTARHEQDWVFTSTPTNRNGVPGIGLYADDRREMMTDYERGVQTGKQLALAWVLGDEWDREGTARELDILEDWVARWREGPIRGSDEYPPPRPSP